jgi:hypothetical protein
MDATNGWLLGAKLDYWRVDIAKFGTPYCSGPFQLGHYPSTQLHPRVASALIVPTPFGSVYSMVIRRFHADIHPDSWFFGTAMSQYLNNLNPRKTDVGCFFIGPIHILAPPPTGWLTEISRVQPATSNGQIHILCTRVCTDALCRSRSGVWMPQFMAMGS